MTGHEIMFNVIVVMAFVASAANHWLLARNRVNRVLIVFMLGCFVFTEGYLAMERPALWLYVVLNLWGLAQFWVTRGRDV